ncbi:MAG: AraC family transcriptional regulator [Clostridium sp.]|nr:AraC family transcriptional regulator [Clostridium sp.]
MLYENEKLENESLYEIFTVNNLSWPLHLHNYYECICVNSGNIEIILDNSRIKLTAGGTIFIFPNQLHELYTPVSSQITILQFASEMIEYFSTQYQGKIPMNPILESFSITIKSHKTDNIFFQKSFLYQICGFLSEHTEFTEYNLSNFCENAILEIIQYIEHNYKDDCTLSKIAYKFGYDYAYISRKFKHKMGISFKKYLNLLRINQACIYLNNTDLSVTDIALQCGFQSIRSFNRNFISTKKITPNEYRHHIHH